MSRRQSGNRKPGRMESERLFPGLAQWVRRQAREMRRVFRVQYRANPQRFRAAAVRALYRALAPRGKRGARRDRRIDLANSLWREQQLKLARGEVRAVNWRKIALACIPDWAQMPPEGRKRSLRRLRNAVHNRAHRAARKAGRRGERSRKVRKQREPDVSAGS